MTFHERPPKLVVTGSAGRIGRILSTVWATHALPDFPVVWTSRSSGPWRDLLAGPLSPCHKDAIILHLAADLSDRPGALERSVDMARNVADAARRGGARHILLASSAAVYGPSDRDLDETAACRPCGPYGRAKLNAEHACKAAGGAVPVTALRIANVVGADALIGNARQGSRLWLDPVPDRPGGPLRSWIGPVTLAQCLAALVGHLRAGRRLPPVLNIANAVPFFMADLLDAAKLDWAYGPPDPATLPQLTLATGRLSRIVPLVSASPASLIAEWDRISDRVGVQ